MLIPHEAQLEKLQNKTRVFFLKLTRAEYEGIVFVNVAQVASSVNFCSQVSNFNSQTLYEP